MQSSSLVRASRIVPLTAIALALLAGCGGGADVPESNLGVKSASAPTSSQGITPTAYAGNFVSSDGEQVCYDLSALGYIGEVTSEMRGIKIDPAVSFSNASISTTVDPTGRLLSWWTSSAQVLAVIVKGGPNFNLYGYLGTSHTSDSGLASPQHRRNTPQISHYNICYTVPVTQGEQGCTPGYWRNHADRWAGVAPADNFDATFGVSLLGATVTLGQAINSSGSHSNLPFHAVAALLNAHGGVPNADGTKVAYKYTPAEVVSKVRTAVETVDDPSTPQDERAMALEVAKNLLATENEKGCPLSGTKAVKVQ